MAEQINDTNQLKQLAESAAKLAEEAARKNAARSEDAQRFGVFSQKKANARAKVSNDATAKSSKVNVSNDASGKTNAIITEEGGTLDSKKVSVLSEDRTLKNDKKNSTPSPKTENSGKRNTADAILMANHPKKKDKKADKIKISDGTKGIDGSGKAKVSDQTAGIPINLDKTKIADGGSDIATARGRARVKGENDSVLKGNQKGKPEEDGVYNTRKATDMTSIANTAVESVKGTYAESDYSSGKSHVKKVAVLAGSGTLTRGMSKVAVRDSLTRTKEEIRSIEQALGFKYKGEQNVDSRHYRVMERSSMSVVKDFDANKKMIEEALEKRGINAKNLNLFEIRSSLKNGELKKWYHRGAQIKLGDHNKDMVVLLKELEKLKKEEANIRRIKSGKGGLKNTAKAWIRESTKDSDTAKGYDVAVTTVKSAKAAGWAIKGAGGTLTDAAISAVEATGLVKNWATGKHADKMIKKAEAKGDAETVKKWTVKKQSAAEKSANIRNKAGSAKEKVNYITKTSLTTKIKDGKIRKYWIEHSKAGQALNKKVITPIKNAKQRTRDRIAARRQRMRERFLARRAGRIAAKAGKGVAKTIGSVLKIFTVVGQMKLIAGLALVFVIILASIFSGVATAFVGSESSSSQVDEAETKEEREEFQQTLFLDMFTQQYTLQKTLRDKWSWTEGTDDEGNPITRYPTIQWIYQGRSYSDNPPEEDWPELTSESSSYSNSEELVGLSYDPTALATNPNYNIAYDQAALYKAVLCAYLGFTDNIKDSVAFARAYMSQLFAQILPDENSSDIDPDASTPGEPCPTLRIYVKNSGLQDIMSLDKTSDFWAHSNGSEGFYSVAMTHWSGWYNIFGQKTEAAESALWFYELEEEDYNELFDFAVESDDGTTEIINYRPKVRDISAPNTINIANGSERNVAYTPADIAKMLSASEVPLSETQRQVLSYAYNAVGSIYSQDWSLRFGPASYDCSGLAYKAWQSSGYNISYYGATTAAAECQGLQENGCEVFIDNGEAMKPGDLIFYGRDPSHPRYNGRHMGIYHVAIYIGGDEMIEAADYDIGVIHNTLNMNNVVAICRPNKNSADNTTVPAA